MNEPCLFEILTLPEESLQRAIPNVSAHSLARLVAAYPRAAGRDLLTVMARCMSQPTMAFFREELNMSRSPTFAQIRDAEQELMRAIHQELPVTEFKRNA